VRPEDRSRPLAHVLELIFSCAAVRTRLDALGPMHVSITLAMPFCLYLLPPSNDKGTALLHIIAHLNATRAPATRTIDPGGVLTFGDGDNDVPMFEVAGMSVAMGNGMEAAKAKAGWVTGTHDEGGVGMFLREVFFHDDGGLCSK
jgi:hydroxymethylpyrimidine pyrophosphatase-like HAD family hydrolase